MLYCLALDLKAAFPCGFIAVNKFSSDEIFVILQPISLFSLLYCLTLNLKIKCPLVLIIFSGFFFCHREVIY